MGRKYTNESRSATVIVSAVGSLSQQADYHCDGVRDGEILRNAFADAIAGGDGVKLLLLEGEYDVDSTLPFDLDGTYGFEFECLGTLKFAAGIGNGIELTNGYSPIIKLKIKDGGQWGDQALLIRGLRGGEFYIHAQDYAGRVVRASEETGSEPKTSMLRFAEFETRDCGQSIYVDATSAFGTFVNAWWFWDTYGPEFHDTGDISFVHVEGGWKTNHGMLFEGCSAVWADMLALGDETNTVTLVEFKGSTANPTIKSINIGILYAFYGSIGLKMSDTSRVYARIISDNCTGGGLVLESVFRSDFDYHGVSSEPDISIDGGDYLDIRMESALCAGDSVLLQNNIVDYLKLKVAIFNPQGHGITDGGSANLLSPGSVITGHINNANQVSGTKYEVDLGGLTNAITLRDLHIGSNTSTAMIKLGSGNSVRMLGGALSGGATKFVNAPSVIKDVEGYVASGDVVSISKVIDHAALTDDGGATGRIDFDNAIPAGSITKTVKCDFTELWNSDNTTTLTMMIGYVGDLDAFNLTADPGENAFNHTTDVFWGESDCQAHRVTAAKTPRVTFTEDDDITHVIGGAGAQGGVIITITYMKA